MTQYAFGIGALIARRTDITNPTPSQFGTLSEASLDLSFSIKELTGQFQAPAALARSGLKITGKAKAARLNAAAFNDVFLGQTLTTGQTLVALQEPGTPTTNSLTVSNNTTFVADLGVINVATGVMMTRVASAPTAGQYAVNESTGVYTFASADSNPPVLVTYDYTVTTGKSIALSNQLMGSGPVFQLVLAETYQGKMLNLKLNSVIAPKLSLGFKNEDFMIPEFDFQASADGQGNIGNIWMSE
jgi:hypothetical protein